MRPIVRVPVRHQPVSRLRASGGTGISIK
jgi:hypothetical protein